ncbi:MAG: DinB family protein [Candidatus Hodarchaeota archaeon]
MNKQKTIQFLKNNHNKLEKVINGLKKSQMVEEIISGKWTTKDILAHISAWNLELTKATDDLLNDEKPWFINEEEMTEAKFNEIETNKRKSLSLNQVLEEWQNSFTELIQRVKKLSTSELEYQTPFEWAKDIPVTVSSLFEYIYRGEGHEGGHAEQIREYFNIKE